MVRLIAEFLKVHAYFYPFGLHELYSARVSEFSE